MGRSKFKPGNVAMFQSGTPKNPSWIEVVVTKIYPCSYGGPLIYIVKNIDTHYEFETTARYLKKKENLEDLLSRLDKAFITLENKN